jgi:hypothetical protein
MTKNMKDNKLGIAVILIISIASAVLAYYAVVYGLLLGRLRDDDVSRFLIMANILAVLGMSLILLDYWFRCRRVENIDKGHKLMVFREKSKVLKVLAVVIGVWLILFGILAILGLTTVSISNLTGLIVVIFLVTISLINKHEIYEKGILHGCEFIRWNEIEGYEWKGKNLTLKLKNGRAINVDRSVESIIRKYLNKQYK